MRDAHAELEITTRQQWRAWLAEHHADARGVWVVTYKRVDPERHVAYDATVEEALCFGWIDSVARSVDATRTALLFTPRKPGGTWAATNKRRIARLEAEGRLEPAGRALIAAAKADGSWTILDGVEAGVLPDDLRAALDADPAARATWDAFTPGARRALHTWVVSAKRPATRARRIEQTVAQAALGRRADEPG